MVKSCALKNDFNADLLGVFSSMDRKPLDLHPGVENTKIRAARLYSDIFSPPSVYAIFAFVLAFTQLPFFTAFLHAAIFSSLTSLLPIIFILIRIRLGQLNDIHLSQPGQRTVPYLLSAFGSLVAYLILRLIGTSPLFLDFILTVIIGLLSLALINSWWMISAHTASITAVAAFTWFAFSPQTALFISPLILTTIFVRYYLRRHTVLELVSGFLLGTFIISGAASLGFFRG